MQANNKVYISVPISLNWNTVTKFIYAAKGSGFSCHYWKRGSDYSQNLLDSCDTVVFLLPDNKFEISRNEMPSGLTMELSSAYAQDKNILGDFIDAIECGIVYVYVDGRWADVIPPSSSRGTNLSDNPRFCEESIMDERLILML